jgi:hypothetical protein
VSFVLQIASYIKHLLDIVCIPLSLTPKGGCQVADITWAADIHGHGGRARLLSRARNHRGGRVANRRQHSGNRHTQLAIDSESFAASIFGDDPRVESIVGSDRAGTVKAVDLRPEIDRGGTELAGGARHERAGLINLGKHPVVQQPEPPCDPVATSPNGNVGASCRSTQIARSERAAQIVIQLPYPASRRHGGSRLTVIPNITQSLRRHACRSDEGNV